MSELSVWEILECAQVNFENVAKMNPGLREHPMWIIATEQLDEAIKKAEAEQKGGPNDP